MRDFVNVFVVCLTMNSYYEWTDTLPENLSDNPDRKNTKDFGKCTHIFPPKRNKANLAMRERILTRNGTNEVLKSLVTCVPSMMGHNEDPSHPHAKYSQDIISKYWNY